MKFVGRMKEVVLQLENLRESGEEVNLHQMNRELRAKLGNPKLVVGENVN